MGCRSQEQGGGVRGRRMRSGGWLYSLSPFCLLTVSLLLLLLSTFKLSVRSFAPTLRPSSSWFSVCLSDCLTTWVWLERAVTEITLCPAFHYAKRWELWAAAAWWWSWCQWIISKLTFTNNLPPTARRGEGGSWFNLGASARRRLLLLSISYLLE